MIKQKQPTWVNQFPLYPEVKLTASKRGAATVLRFCYRKKWYRQLFLESVFGNDDSVLINDAEQVLGNIHKAVLLQKMFGKHVGCIIKLKDQDGFPLRWYDEFSQETEKNRLARANKGLWGGVLTGTK